MPADIQALEEKILAEANEVYFKSKLESGAKFRITPLQAHCIIRAFIKNLSLVLENNSAE